MRLGLWTISLHGAPWCECCHVDARASCEVQRTAILHSHVVPLWSRTAFCFTEFETQLQLMFFFFLFRLFWSFEVGWSGCWKNTHTHNGLFRRDRFWKRLKTRMLQDLRMVAFRLQKKSWWCLVVVVWVDCVACGALKLFGFKNELHGAIFSSSFFRTCLGDTADVGMI